MFADADEMIEQGKFQHRMLHRSNAECAVMEICCCAWWRLGSDQSAVGLVGPVWVLLELAACGPLGRGRISMTLESIRSSTKCEVSSRFS